MADPGRKRRLTKTSDGESSEHESRLATAAIGSASSPGTSRSTPAMRSSLRRRRLDPPEDIIPTKSDGGEDGDEDSDDEADPMEGKNMQCCRS